MLARAFDASFPRSSRPSTVAPQSFARGQSVRAVTAANSATVFVEGHVHKPAEAVLDPPVPPNAFCYHRGIRREAGQVVASFETALRPSSGCSQSSPPTAVHSTSACRFLGLPREQPAWHLPSAVFRSKLSAARRIDSGPLPLICCFPKKSGQPSTNSGAPSSCSPNRQSTSAPSTWSGRSATREMPSGSNAQSP